MLTEAARTSRPRLSKSKNKKSVDPSRVLHVLGDHILLDGFKIVLDQEKHRQPAKARRVNGFVELSLAGRALAGTNQDDFVFVEALRDVQQLRAQGCLGATDSLKELRPGRRRR